MVVLVVRQLAIDCPGRRALVNIEVDAEGAATARLRLVVRVVAVAVDVGGALVRILDSS